MPGRDLAIEAAVVAPAVVDDVTQTLAALATAALPDLLEEVELFVRERERELAPARAYLADIRNEIVRRMDAEHATVLKLGAHTVRFVAIPASATVRTHLIDGPLLDTLRNLVPGGILNKAIGVKEVPASVEIKTHLTYLKKFKECGAAAKAIYDRLVDEGQPTRRLVVERDSKVVTPT
ncbi:MAG: hypothetical protein NVS2B17_31100 [Candidatus Velthaea sp.]